MMTRRNVSSSGFTLVEIILVLFVIAIVVGFSIPSAASYLKHHDVEDASKMLLSLSKAAHREAILKHTDHYIVLNRDHFSLFSTSDTENPIEELYLDEAVNYQIKLWPDTEWRTPDATKWMFAANGLVFPLTVTFRDDSAWQTLTFDPLTGGILEESYQYP